MLFVAAWLCHAHPQSLAVCGSTCGCAVKAHPPNPMIPSNASTEVLTKRPSVFIKQPSRSLTHNVSRELGSSSYGTPASYRACTRPPQKTTLVFARFFVRRSRALPKIPPGLRVPKVPRYWISSAASSSKNSSVRTNRARTNAVFEAGSKSKLTTRPSPSRKCSYAMPPRSNLPAPLRNSMPSSSCGMMPSTRPAYANSVCGVSSLTAWRQSS
mmetsp:Transcript_15949/g.34933  ORF Transcript_15949/g.34933 Transcript_15949/m.34933 type:complete len:213 (+) Transcript_15949:1022-1660(+)